MNRSLLSPIIFFVVLLSLQATSVFSQAVIQGRINDSAQNPLSGCNVLLLNRADSSLVRGTISKDNGYFELPGAANGNYLLAFSFSGYQKKYMPLEISGTQKKDIGNILLMPAVGKLKQVMVTAFKPLFEQMPDRTVVNVKNSITNAGITVLNVLEKSPGILVNRQNGVISMSGKDGVQVMINGKRTYLANDALISMLEAMNAANVEKIELITTPPAKYDAAGNAGYINIVLQQNPDEGFAANISLTMAAFYGTAPSANFDFNYRKRRSNFYGSYGFSRLTQKLQRYNYRSIDLYNEFLENNTTANLYRGRPTHNLRVGYDYEWNKKTTIGLLISGYHNAFNEDGELRSVFSTNHAIDTIVVIGSHEKNPWKNAMANIYLQHKPNKISQLSFNLDVLYYHNNDLATYNNRYFNSSNDFVYADDRLSSQEADFSILPVQFDYKRKVNEKINIEAGVKAVTSKFTNKILVGSIQSTGLEPDPDYTSTYKLREDIKAAYISSTFLVNKKNTLQAGLRYEYTDANLGTNDEKDIVNRHYGNLFPSVYWSHKLRGNNSFNLSFSRRINRPAFSQLAPFLFFTDPTTVVTGNPALQPAISNALNFDYLIKQFVVSISYTHEANSLNGFLPLVDTITKKQVNIPRNITYLKTVNARFILPLTITPWWSSVVNLNFTWLKGRAADYVSVAKEKETIRASVTGSETFRFKKRYTIELSGLYVTKGLGANGVSIREPYGNLNIAAQRKFKNPGTALTVGVDNIFSSMNIRAFTDVPEENFFIRVSLPSTKRIYKITFTHRFGNKAMKDKKMRSTASEEERKRLGN